MAGPRPQSPKREQLLQQLLSGPQKPSGVLDHELTAQGLKLTISIPKDKLGASTRDLLALLLSDAM